MSDCYAVNSTIKATSKVAGGIAGDNRGDVSENDRKGMIKNCYTDCDNINYNQNNGNIEAVKQIFWYMISPREELHMR